LKTWIAALAGVSGVLSALCASSAGAEPESDLERQAAMAQRFAPFDTGGGPGWENAFQTPFIRQVAAGQPEPVQFALKPGVYMIVVLCNCKTMKVTLVNSGGTTLTPIRSSDQGAMYSLEVVTAGEYLTGIDMGDCDEKACDIGVKVYHKKS
jgi:hypothetical protein